MDSNARFRLRFTAYSPETIPMARLAEYMHELATLMGSQAHVHYRGATTGSTVLNVEVEACDVKRVENRLRNATSVDAPAEVRKAIARLEALMHADNARGSLLGEGGERFIKFSGIDTLIAERIGPIREEATLDGELVRVGGKDRTVHALLVASNGDEYKVNTTNRELARRLAGHLFEKVRVMGLATWYRNIDGKWELAELKLEDFYPLAKRTLIEAVEELRSIQGSEWKDDPDPLGTLRALRKH